MNMVEMFTDDSGNILESNILLKVTKREYAEDIRAGKLYMNKLSYFRKLEQEGIGDEEEGLIDTAEKGIITCKGQPVIEVRNIRTFFNCPVFCTLSVPLKRQEDGRVKYVVPSKLLRAPNKT